MVTPSVRFLSRATAGRQTVVSTHPSLLRAVPISPASAILSKRFEVSFLKYLREERVEGGVYRFLSASSFPSLLFSQGMLAPLLTTLLPDNDFRRRE